jgi:hypothetical protein
MRNCPVTVFAQMIGMPRLLKSASVRAVQVIPSTDDQGTF